MMQPQHQSGVRLSFGFSRSRRGTLIQDSMRLMMLFDNFSYSGKYSQPLPLIIAGFTIFAPMNRLSGAVCLSPGSGRPRRAIPKGKHLRKDCHPERKASPNGTPSRKETHLRKDCQPERKRISERTATPKGPQSRKETHPPGEKKIVTLCWKVLAFSAFS